MGIRLLLFFLALGGVASSCTFARNEAAPETSSVLALAQCGVDVRPQDVSDGDYGGFYTWPELVEQMANWAKHTDVVSVESLGKSVEGRPIPLFHISGKTKTFAPKPEIFYLVGVHPREQAPTICIVRFINELLDGYGRDDEITHLLDTRTIWIVPMLNVDGKIFDFQHGNGKTRGADWRKNRRENKDGTYGVDLNRNFPVRWGGNRAYDKAWKTTTTDTKGNIYEGPAPASEPETRAVMNFISHHPLRVVLDLHSPLHDMRSPGFLSQSEHDVFAGLLREMQATQKQPYPLQLPKTGGEPLTETRGGDSGISYPWAYYSTGAYSFNIEIGLKGRYPSPATVEQEYKDNIRGPLFTLLRECADLKLATRGHLSFGASKWEGTPKAGERVVWRPQIKGAFSFAVAQSDNAAGIIPMEFHLAPATRGFPILIQKDAKAGTRIPLTLYVWTAARQLSIYKETLVVR
ncbi:zinc carboxypeptidase [Abditibacteriota bacterium]|nr:zinc carboxypeptidase [Abditibacteriota bacterium]